MKVLYILLLIIGLNTVLLAQDTIDYNAFQGEEIDIVLNTPFKTAKIHFYDHSKLTPQKDLKRRTIKDKEVSYASSPHVVLAKIYHASRVEDLYPWLDNDTLAKRFEIKKVKDYLKNHFIIDYLIGNEFGNGRIAIVKYTEVKNGIEIGKHTLQTRVKYGVGKKGRPGYLIVDLPELAPIEYLVQSLSGAAFVAFYEGGESTHKVINQLRERALSEDKRRLNLDRLAVVLKNVEDKDPALWKQLQAIK